MGSSLRFGTGSSQGGPDSSQDESDQEGKEYGFGEGGLYTLASFQVKANAFKTAYFDGKWDPVAAAGANGTPSDGGVSEAMMEREFWRLVGSPFGDLEVEYGSDLHSSVHGSGFPSPGSTNSHLPYASDGWNLTVFPTFPPSLLRWVGGDISGMKVPWLYVGMAFSAFCWHNEDHYTGSVNYLHWGETKTWYGIPGADARAFEEAMREEAPELFIHQPDLLFHLVTIMSPESLREKGVRVSTCHQRPGQLVLTFPRAYHAGFNHGFNFAEAVNFAPPDWIPQGRSCVRRYRRFGRNPVFSHDELLWTLWERCRGNGPGLALDSDSGRSRPTREAEKELVAHHVHSMVQRELALRRQLLHMMPQDQDPLEIRSGWARDNPGFGQAIKKEEGGEEESDLRQCKKCKTYLFHSALVCRGCDQAVCLECGMDEDGPMSTIIQLKREAPSSSSSSQEDLLGSSGRAGLPSKQEQGEEEEEGEGTWCGGCGQWPILAVRDEEEVLTRVAKETLLPPLKLKLDPTAH